MKVFPFYILPLCLAVIGLTLFFSVSQVSAQEACTCFCTSTRGSVEAGSLLPADCQAECTKSGGRVISCATTYAQYPDRQPRCFSQDQCFEAIVAAQNSTGQEGGVYADGTFSLTNSPSYQPPECPKDFGYCYPPQKSYTLGVSFGEITIVQGFSDYISKAYNYLLGISVTIVIVMVMIGGLQYVLSAGTGNIQKAKERISNAIIGFMLLSFAYVILFTVNPNLVSLRLPQLPMVKRVVLVGDDSCDDLEEKGFELDYENIMDDKGNIVDYADAWCGTSTKVLSDNNGLPVPDGTTCNWKQCEEAGTLCASTTPPSCIKCEDATTENGFRADAKMCGSLKPEDEFDRLNNPSKLYFCEYTEDPGMTASISGALSAINPISGNGMCASYSFDCTKMLSCRDYDSVLAVSGTGGAETECLESLGYYEAGSASSNSLTGFSPRFIKTGGVNFESICSSDPCGLAPTGERCEPLQAPAAAGVGWEWDCVNSGFASVFRADIVKVQESYLSTAFTFLDLFSSGEASKAAALEVYLIDIAKGVAKDKNDASIYKDAFTERVTCPIQ